MTVRVVKVIRAIYPPDGPWRIVAKDKDRNLVLDEELVPDSFLKELQGARLEAYYRAEKSVDGWNFRQRYKGRPLYW